MKRIMLLGAGGPAGVNFCRCLEREKDIEIYGIDTNRYNLNLAKPYCKKVFQIPQFKKDKIEKVEFINDILDKYDINFIHAQPDPEVLFLSYFRDVIKAETFLPSHLTIVKCQDKYETAVLWEREFGLTEPYKIERTTELEDLSTAYRCFDWPFWLRATKGAGGKASLCVKNLEQAYHWCKFWHDFNKDIEMIAQPYLTEPNIAWQSLWKDGELIVSQGRQRIEALYGRMTVSGISGSSSVSKLFNHPKANEAAIKAILEIDTKPHGIYSVDMMSWYDNFIPTEINAGRFFTMSYLLGKAARETNIPRGNIPLMYVKLAFGEELPKGSTTSILPEALYWIRHVDCGTHLIWKEDLV